MRGDDRCFAGEGAPPITMQSTSIEEDPSVTSPTLMCFVTNQSRRIEGSCTGPAAIEATSTQQAHGDGSGQLGVAHEDCCAGLTTIEAHGDVPGQFEGGKEGKIVVSAQEEIEPSIQTPETPEFSSPIPPFDQLVKQQATI
jgi:hypothetical protein